MTQILYSGYLEEDANQNAWCKVKIPYEIDRLVYNNWSCSLKKNSKCIIGWMENTRRYEFIAVDIGGSNG